MAANPSTEPCRYCTATPAELDSQMALVTELAHSRVFLVRDQTHPGRCVVLLKRHARELFELAPDELAAFMAEQGFTKPQIRRIMHDNPLAFYSQTPKFKPQLDLPSIDPATYQR